MCRATSIAADPGCNGPTAFEFKWITRDRIKMSTDRSNEWRKEERKDGGMEGRGEKWRPFCDLFVPIGNAEG